ncbi:MAG: hypothetical protein R3E35_10550 [Rhodocyclaceae bacterium]
MSDGAPPPSAETPQSVRCAIYARVSVADAGHRELTSITRQHWRGGQT